LSFFGACGPGLFLKCFSLPSGRGFLFENVFKGHAARAFLPSGQVFRLFGESLFFCARKKKVTKKKRRPAGLFASLATLLGLSSFVFLQRGSRNHVQNMERVGTALCIQPRVFDTRLSNSLYANFTLPHVNPRVDRKQCKVDTSTALYSRLLKAGGWPQKLLLTRSKFRTTFRDPR